jgi:hypothetical protein
VTLLHGSRGYIDDLVASLRIDPTSAIAAFPVIRGPDFRTIVLAEGQGFLDDEVFEDQGVVVLDRLTWLGN